MATADMITGRKMMTRKMWVIRDRRLSMSARPSDTVFWKMKMKMKSWDELTAACQNRSLCRSSTEIRQPDRSRADRARSSRTD